MTAYTPHTTVIPQSVAADTRARCTASWPGGIPAHPTPYRPAIAHPTPAPLSAPIRRHGRQERV